MAETLSERAVFKLSPTLLDVTDRAAAASFSSRANYIRGALIERIRREQIALFDAHLNRTTDEHGPQ